MLADTRIVYVWLLKCQALSGACQADSDNTVHRRIEMPLIQVRVIKDVFSKDQKRQIIKKLTDAMVSIEGENMRGVTWVTVEEVESGDWGIGGNALTRASCTRWPQARPPYILIFSKNGEAGTGPPLS